MRKISTEEKRYAYYIAKALMDLAKTFQYSLEGEEHRFFLEIPMDKFTRDEIKEELEDVQGLIHGEDYEIK